MTKISPKGTSWNEYRQNFLSKEEIIENDLKADLLAKLVEAREKEGLTKAPT